MNTDNNSGELALKENNVGKYRLLISVDGYVFATYVNVIDAIQFSEV